MFVVNKQFTKDIECVVFITNLRNNKVYIRMLVKKEVIVVWKKAFSS